MIIAMQNVIIADGTLVFEKVTRHDDGAYLCIARNGIPPSRSRRISLSVLCEYYYIVALLLVH